MEGKAYGWGYKFENDFAGQSGTTGSGFREMWIGTDFMGHNVRLGQAKPYRSMEELTSSNEITFMERPFASASGLYSGRQFQQGVFVDAADKMGDMAYGYGVAAYNTRSAAGNNTQGMGYNLRGYVAPLNADGQVLHIGVSGSVDRNPMDNGKAASSSAAAVPPATSNDYKFSATPVRGAELKQDMAASFTKQEAVGIEVAYAMGPFSAQAEYATADHDFFGATKPEKIDTGYVQASFFVTDHARKYDAKKGVFKSPSVNAGAGAIELKARYDMMENKDTKAEATQYMVGANYYINPNTRVMFEYVDGSTKDTLAKKGVEKDASAIQTRLQFSF